MDRRQSGRPIDGQTEKREAEKQEWALCVSMTLLSIEPRQDSCRLYPHHLIQLRKRVINVLGIPWMCRPFHTSGHNTVR